ncbi:hypothetical protein N8663_00405 [Verrucomicrobia bacterium]|nr:hypothetical protein [Verrucomicrobiota bacterium]
MNLSRRTFVRTFLFNAAWMTGLGRMHRLPLLGELSPSPDGNQGILNVRPEEYKTLQEVGGVGSIGIQPYPLQPSTRRNASPYPDQPS